MAFRTIALAMATFVSDVTSSPMPARRHRSWPSVQDVGRYKRRSINTLPRPVA